MTTRRVLLTLGSLLLGACSYSWSEVPLHPNTPPEPARTTGSSVGLDDPELPRVVVGNTYEVRLERVRLHVEGEAPEWLTRGDHLTYDAAKDEWTLPDLRVVPAVRIDGLFERRFDAGRSVLFSILWSLLATAAAAGMAFGGFAAVCVATGCISSG